MIPGQVEVPCSALAELLELAKLGQVVRGENLRRRARALSSSVFHEEREAARANVLEADALVVAGADAIAQGKACLGRAATVAEALEHLQVVMPPPGATPLLAPGSELSSHGGRS